jgi:S-adenosylmethionine hydrolase
MSVVTFLTDYGLRDDFAGVCHGVIARIAPRARILDITHGVARHDVRSGALILRRAVPFMPAGVHLAVVDPQVGGRRRALALRCAAQDRLLVGPDNGLLAPLAERLGGVLQAVDIGCSPLRLEPLSASFHGRDVFAPVAAHLASGTPLADCGEPLDPAQLVALELPQARVEQDSIVAHVLTVDHYGNVALDVEHDELAASGLRLGREVAVNGRPALHAATFSDVPAGGLVLYEDGYGVLSVAVNRGSALHALGLELDAEVRIEPAP